MARKPVRRIVFQILAALAAALPMLPLDAAVAVSVADRAGASATPATDRGYQRLMNATHAVVGVKVKAIADARSNESLGQEREGSGVAIGKEGLILTIGYLILEADSIEVTDYQGQKVPATTVAYDHATGFGLVRPMGPIASRPITLGTALTVTQLDRMMIVTGGEEQNISIATVVSRRPFAGYWEYQIDNAIFTSPPRLDHSGAALINKEGELVGIGSHFVLDEMVKTGGQQAGRRPWLGVNSLEEDGRIKVVQVNEESPAALAGIQPGDIILSIDGQPIQTLESFYFKLWTRGPAGVDVVLKVLHGASLRDVVVRSIDRAEFMRKRPTI